jgi:acetylornithine deacetylase/succinyl-diaminopimelate desuccinylase-like protein
MKIECRLSLALFLVVVPLLGGEDFRSALEAYVTRHQREILTELIGLVSIPNVAADSPNIRRNAELLREMLVRRGLEAEILETGGNPLVYGERKVPGAARTSLFYMHYDGQPVDPPLWKQSSPFRPVLRDGRLEDGGREITDYAALQNFRDDWRLYARSASDDKSPIVAFCGALDALRSSGRQPARNIRIVLDGEEEAGSPNLTAAIGRYRDRFRADVIYILDGPLHPSGRHTLAFGARGNVTLELKVYGPKFALHSGHYGNWVPNPAMRLAQLLASMKDSRGRVLVKGFYDGIPPLGPEEKRILASVPDDMEGLKQLFGIAEPETIGENLQEALQYPTLNVRGLRSAYVGADARTIIPSEAIASIDIRLVKDTPGSQIVDKVLAHIRDQGFHVVTADPDDATRRRYPRIVRVTERNGTEAYRTEMGHPESVRAAKALERTWGAEPVRIRTMGGTVPISQFIRDLGFPAIGLPTVNFDNNQHSENENLRLGHLWKSIVSIAALLTIE